MATYGLKFYKNIQGFNAFDGRRYPVSLKIYEKNYNGATVEIDALAANSIRISYGNSGDRRYEPIKKTSIDFAIIDTDQFDYTQFYTSDATKFKVEIDALGFKNVGFIVQDSFSRSLSYKAAIHLTAIDNLSILDDIESKSLVFDKYERIGSIIYKIISKCYPGASVRFDTFNQYYGGAPLSGSLICGYEKLMVNTGSFEKKNLKEVLESILLSGMLYIFQSGEGYIIREYTSDYTQKKLLHRKITAHFEGGGELSMTPAVRKFKLEQELEESDTFSGYNPTKNDDYKYTPSSEKYYFSYYSLKKWANITGHSVRKIDNKNVQIYSDGVSMYWQGAEVSGGGEVVDKSGYNLFVFPDMPIGMGSFNQHSIAEIGLMPGAFSILMDVDTQLAVYPVGTNKVSTSQLKNISYKYAVMYTERGTTYYYDADRNTFSTAYKANLVTVNNAMGDMKIKVDIPSVLNVNSKVFSFALYPAFSSDLNDPSIGLLMNSPITTKIKTLAIIPKEDMQRFDSQKVDILVGENNLDMSEEVVYTASPNAPLEGMLYYNNILLNSVGENMLTTQFVNLNPDLNIGDMRVMEYQARACLFLTEAPAKKINGGVFLNTSDMVADYTAVNSATDYLSSGKDQIVLADIDSSKQITRVDTLFDFIISSKYGDYRMNQAEINLLNFSIDGEFCEVREFYISDYIAGEPIINTFIQKNYLKHR